MHYYTEEERYEAIMEAKRDAWLDRAARCPNGHYWDPGYHRATRMDPAYEDEPQCPFCGEEHCE